MAAYLYGIQSYKQDNKIYLQGYLRGKESGKKYCIKYYKTGTGAGPENVANRTYSYTFTSTTTDLNLTNLGCYIPDQGDGEYTILVEEVNINCSDFVDFVDSVYIQVGAPEPSETRWLSIASTDLNGVRIPNVSFRIKNLTDGSSDYLSTNSSGYFEKQFTTGSYQIYPSIPSGYEGTVSSISVTLNTDKYIVIEFKKTEITDPDCYFKVYVKGTETQLPIQGATVKTSSSTGGTNTGTTNSTGYTTIKINCGHTYRITVSKDGYDSASKLKEASTGTISVSIPLSIGWTGMCPAASAYFEFDRKIAGVGEFITVTGKAHHNDMYQNHSWDWGDTTITTDPVTKHAYTKSGTYTVTHTVENECGNTDTVQGVVTIQDELTHTLNIPSEIHTETRFMATINSDPNRLFVIRDVYFLHEYGSGTTDSSGYVEIACVINEPGTYTIHGYSQGNQYPGDDPDIITNEVSTNATTAPPPDPITDITAGEFTLEAPSIVMTETEFTVSGKHPQVGQKIDIKVDKGFAIDPILASGYVSAKGTYEITCQMDEFGYDSIYAYDPTWLEEWWLIADAPSGWIPGKGAVSNSQTVIVMTWTIIAALGLIVALVLEKQYNYLGIFKK